MTRSDFGKNKAKTETSLGEALKTFLHGSGLGTLLKHSHIIKTWQQIVGPEISAHTRLVGFQRGRVEIAVDSSALRNELEFSRQRILSQLQQEIKKPFIARVSFILKPIREDDD